MQDAAYIAGLLGALIELIDDPTDEKHGAGIVEGALGEMLEDLGRVSYQLAGQPVPDEMRHTGTARGLGLRIKSYDADPDLVAEFLRYENPRELHETGLDDPFPYYRPDWQPTQRDDDMLTLAAVGVVLDYVVGPNKGNDPRRHRAGLTEYELARELWLKASEMREVQQMREVLRGAIEARYDKRIVPLEESPAQHTVPDALDAMLAAILANAPTAEPEPEPEPATSRAGEVIPLTDVEWGTYVEIKNAMGPTGSRIDVQRGYVTKLPRIYTGGEGGTNKPKFKGVPLLSFNLDEPNARGGGLVIGMLAMPDAVVTVLDSPADRPLKQKMHLSRRMPTVDLRVGDTFYLYDEPGGLHEEPFKPRYHVQADPKPIGRDRCEIEVLVDGKLTTKTVDCYVWADILDPREVPFQSAKTTVVVGEPAGPPCGAYDEVTRAVCVVVGEHGTHDNGKGTSWPAAGRAEPPAEDALDATLAAVLAAMEIEITRQLTEAYGTAVLV